MDDKTRINILKGMLLITAGVGLLNVSNVKRLQKENKSLRKRCDIAGRIINRFTELTTEQVQQTIVDEFEFDWVVKDVDL